MHDAVSGQWNQHAAQAVHWVSSGKRRRHVCFPDQTSGGRIFAAHCRHVAARRQSSKLIK